MWKDPKGSWDPNKHVNPRAKCADGFEISIQANKSAYCRPREDRDEFEGDYSAVEIGCWPQPEIDEDAMEGELSSGEFYYAYVPVGTVNAILARHGGVIENAEYLPPGVKSGYQENWLTERWEALLGQPL